jgi:hypothetical protein
VRQRLSRLLAIVMTIVPVLAASGIKWPGAQ